MQRSISGTSMDSAGSTSLDKIPERDPKDELRDYALRLLASTSTGTRGSRLDFPTPSGRESIALGGTMTGDGGDRDAEPVDCREAVEVLTRNMRKGEPSPLSHPDPYSYALQYRTMSTKTDLRSQS